MPTTKIIENANDSLAFKKFTNNRYKFEQVEGETVYRMTPGLNEEEMLGMIIPIVPDLNGYAMVLSAVATPGASLPEGYKDRNDIYGLMIVNADLVLDATSVPFILLAYCGETGKVKRPASKISAEDLAEITAKG